MKNFVLVLLIFLTAASCGSMICSSTNSSCTFGASQTSNSSNISNIISSRSNFETRNYNAAIISDLSPDPILIEDINSDLIQRESNWQQI